MFYCGLDLAASEKNPSGLAFLKQVQGKPTFVKSSLLHSDQEIIDVIREQRPSIVAIDAPLTKGKEAYRQAEKKLIKLGLKLFPPTFLSQLTNRAIKLDKELKIEKFTTLEVHPKSSLRLLGIDGTRSEILKSLAKLIDNLPAQLKSHELDAIVAAYTAYLFDEGKAKLVGDPLEGYIAVPYPKIKLAVFDLDGTLTKPISSWEHLHRHLGTWEKGGKENLVKFLAGELSYQEFADLDAQYWVGMSVSDVKAIAGEVQYVEGAHELVKLMKKQGAEIAIISGGLSVIAEKAASDFEIKYWWANDLLTSGGQLTGEVKVNVSFNGKLEIYNKLLEKLNLKPYQVLTIGDTDGDINLFENSGLCIAINPLSPRVAQAADYVVEDLRQALEIIKK